MRAYLVVARIYIVQRQVAVGILVDQRHLAEDLGRHLLVALWHVIRQPQALRRDVRSIGRCHHEEQIGTT